MVLDRVGQQLGNYKLVRLLGQGGFAEVYLGEHVYLKTPAAIKVLKLQLAGNDLQDFLREAKTVTALRHNNIVRVLEFGLEGSTPFLVMEYASNGSLRQRHAKGERLPLDTVIAYVKQVAAALQYSHNHKITHCDIKPENMLLTNDGQVIISDFGLATITRSTASQSLHHVAGTAQYMAPEQFRGKACPASDQYALAVTVYQWLCGTPPFTLGDFIQLGYQHTSVPPSPLREKNATIPTAVEQVVLKALAKDPAQRFPSVQDFATALEQAYQKSQDFRFVQLPIAAFPYHSSTSIQSNPQARQPVVTAPFNKSSQPPPPQIQVPLPPPKQTLPQSQRTPKLILFGLLILVVSSVIVYFMSLSSFTGSSRSSTPTGQITTTPTQSSTPTSVHSSNVVHISDQSQVLNFSQVQSEAEKLPYPIDIYTTNTFSGTTSDFDQRTRSHLTSPNLIVIAIDTVHRHLAIVGGSSVPLSNSQYRDAVHAFQNNFNNGDYTGATVASIRSLEHSLGVSSQ